MRRTAKDTLIGILSVAGWQGFPRCKPVGASSVFLALCTQEERGTLPFAVESVRQIIEMGYVADLHTALYQGPNHLSRELGAFALVGRGEGFVAQQQPMAGYCIGDTTHSAELFIEFPALHAGIFLPFEVGKDAATHCGGQ